MLDPVVPTEHSVKDSFSFCKEIQEVKNLKNFLKNL